MAALQEGTCAAPTLQEHVAAVYSTVEQALSTGAERGKTPDALDCANTLMYIRAYKPEVEPEMREKYKGCGRPAWTVYYPHVHGNHSGSSQRSPGERGSLNKSLKLVAWLTGPQLPGG